MPELKIAAETEHTLSLRLCHSGNQENKKNTIVNLRLLLVLLKNYFTFVAGIVKRSAFPSSNPFPSSNLHLQFFSFEPTRLKQAFPASVQLNNYTLRRLFTIYLLRDQ